MANTHNPDMTPGLVNAYEPGEHPDWPAPSSVKGPMHWIKTNLFGSVTNTLLTLLTIYLLYKIIPAMVDWMFIDAAYTGPSSGLGCSCSSTASIRRPSAGEST